MKFGWRPELYRQDIQNPWASAFYWLVIRFAELYVIFMFFNWYMDTKIVDLKYPIAFTILLIIGEYVRNLGKFKSQTEIFMLIDRVLAQQEQIDRLNRELYLLKKRVEGEPQEEAE